MPLSGKDTTEDLPILPKKKQVQPEPQGDGDDLPILKKKEGTASAGGTKNTSPSASSSNLETPKRTEDHLKNIVDLAHTQTYGLPMFQNQNKEFPKPENPVEENEKKQFMDRVASGEPDAIVSVIAKQRESLKKSLDELPNMNTTTARFGGNLKEEVDQARADLSGREKHIIESGIAVLSKAYAKKWNDSPVKDDVAANEIGKQLRSQLSKIGADNNFVDQNEIVQSVIRRKTVSAEEQIKQKGYALGIQHSKTKNPLESENKARANEVEKNHQEYQFQNIVTVYNSVAQDHAEEIEKLKENDKVKQYLDGLKALKVDTKEGETRSFIDSTLNSNRKVPFVDRIINADKYPVRKNPDGSVSTHLMASASDDKGAFVYPTLRLVNGKWVENKNPDDAIKAGDIIRFKNDAEAENFATNYKSTTFLEAIDKKTADFKLNNNVAGLQNDPNVQKFISLNREYKEVADNVHGLINKFPQVKADIMRAKVADAWAKVVKSDPVKTINEVMPGGNSFEYVKDIVMGRSPSSDGDIKSIAKMAGISEEEVRKYMDDAKIPSYLGYAAREFGNVFVETAEGLNRMFEPKVDADIQNRILDHSKYHLPEAFELSTGNINPESILYKTFGTMGTIGAFAAEAELGGEITGLSRFSSLAKADLNILKSAEEILPAPKYADLLVKMGLADTPEDALQGIIDATRKAQNFAGSYAVAHATSYEDAYKEAAKFTSDEKVRQKYASEIATANGLSMLVFNSAEFADKLFIGKDKNKLIADFLKSKTPFSEKNNLLSRLTSAAKTVGLANAQQLIPMIQEVNAKSQIFNYHTSSSEFFKKALDGVITNSIGMLPLGFIGSSKAHTSDHLKESVFEAGIRRDYIVKNIEDKYDRGVISPEERDRQIKMVNTIAGIVKEIPDQANGRTLSQKQKNDIAYSILKQRSSQEMAEKTDPSLKKFYEEDVKQAGKDVEAAINEPDKPAEDQVMAKDPKTLSKGAKVLMDAVDSGAFQGTWADVVKANPEHADAILKEIALQSHGLEPDGKTPMKGGSREQDYFKDANGEPKSEEHQAQMRKVIDAAKEAYPLPEELKPYAENKDNIPGLAQKIIKGEDLTDEDLRLQSNFPKELQKELKDSSDKDIINKELPEELKTKKVQVKVVDPRTGLEGKKNMDADLAVRRMREQYKTLEGIIGCLTKKVV